MIQTGKITIGGNNFAVIAGPTVVKSEEEIDSFAKFAKGCGVSFLTAYDINIEGASGASLKNIGLRMLRMAGNATKMPIVYEAASIEELQNIVRYADIVDVSDKLLKDKEALNALADMRTPIMLKRPFDGRITDVLLAAEYIINRGNGEILICERGLSCNERHTDYTLDLTVIPTVKKLLKVDVPVIIDVSYAGRKFRTYEAMAKAAIGAGADGIILPVHSSFLVKSDSRSISYEELRNLITSIRPNLKAEGRTLSTIL